MADIVNLLNCPHTPIFYTTYIKDMGRKRSISFLASIPCRYNEYSAKTTP